MIWLANGIAAVEALRENAAIDPARVGIHGHSQGGTLAPLVALKSRAAFVIASAAAGLPVEHWRNVAVPVLLVYGALDKRVPARPSAARIAQALVEGGSDSVSVQLFPGADHTFRLRSPDRTT